MATTEAVCECGCARTCHRRGLRWGQTVYATCRHHPMCGEYRQAPPVRRPVVSPVVTSYDAWVCLSCGARYVQRYGDHPCGELVPVVVTIARREVV